MPATANRTVHAVVERDDLITEVVRYERAGKWYLEIPGGRRKAVTLPAAVAFVADGVAHAAHNVTWRHDRPGGNQFDAKVRAFWPTPT